MLKQLIFVTHIHIHIILTFLFTHFIKKFFNHDFAFYETNICFTHT